ncbi:MAG: STAS domain-containing protein [Methylococcales bacterium]|nr:STAS domain-containing protein [Methylococcales bacterium]
MSRLLLIEQAPGYYHVTGSLTFANIDRRTLKSLKFLKGAGSICIDLAKVEATDSAGLALMIEWIKLSRSNNIRLAFKNIPEQLYTLAKLSGFDKNEYFSSDAR